MFHVYRQRDAAAAATLLSALLENQALEKRMRDLSGLLLSGQLAAGFGHEIHNKLQILNLQFDALAAGLNDAIRDGRALQGATADELDAAMRRAVSASTELQRTALQFRNLVGSRALETVDVNEVARQAHELIAPIARRAQVSVSLALDEAAPTVWGSRLGLQQVLLNLLLNATQHTGAKRDPIKSVTLRTDRSPTSGRVEIRVIDTGPGIHYKLWEKVFDLGFTTRGEEGSGLGLFIARSLLNPMGGRIRVESSYVPLGAAFLVDLPAMREGRAEGAAQ